MITLDSTGFYKGLPPLFSVSDENARLVELADLRRDFFLRITEIEPLGRAIGDHLQSILQGEGAWSFLIEDRPKAKRLKLLSEIPNIDHAVRKLSCTRPGYQVEAQRLYDGLPWLAPKLNLWSSTSASTMGLEGETSFQGVCSSWDCILYCRNEFALPNLRLVAERARSLHIPNLDFEDEKAEGVFGLLRAIIGFNPKITNRFSTYAKRWVDQSIRSYHREIGQHVIRTPAYIKSLLSKLRSARHSFFIEHGRKPTVEELATLLDCTEKRVRNAIDAESLSACELKTCKPTSKKAGVRLDEELILNIVREALSPLEFELICKRFGLGEEQGQTPFRELKPLCPELGRSPQTIIGRALRKLKQVAELDDLFENQEL